MRRFVIGLVTGILVAVSTHSLVAGFILRNQRVSTIQGTRSLTIDELSQAVMADEDRLETVQAELIKSRADNQKLRKDIEEIEASLTQFKNLYFRRF